MKSASVTSFLPAVVAAGLTIASSAFSPVNAYSVTVTGQKAGNPGGDLVDVSLAGYDEGKTLDPVKWLVPAKGTNSGVDLTASASIKVEGFTSKLLSLAITLSNTTAVGFQSAILGLGLGVDPNATVNGNLFNDVNVDANGSFPGGFKNVDVCVYAAHNCSSGNVNQGLSSGSSETFLLNISGNFGATPAVTLSNFALKFQTQDGSYEAASVPEPITVVGSGLALGFGALFKRELSKKRNKAKVKV